MLVSNAGHRQIVVDITVFVAPVLVGRFERPVGLVRFAVVVLGQSVGRRQVVVGRRGRGQALLLDHATERPAKRSLKQKNNKSIDLRG